MKGNLDLGGEIVVLTGAGVSQESGLATFRDKDGIWSRVSIEEVATPEAFRSNPERVHAFYNKRRRGLLESMWRRARDPARSCRSSMFCVTSSTSPGQLRSRLASA